MCHPFCGSAPSGRPENPRSWPAKAGPIKYHAYQRRRTLTRRSAPKNSSAKNGRSLAPARRGARQRPENRRHAPGHHPNDWRRRRHRRERTMALRRTFDGHSSSALGPLRERAGVDENERSRRGPRICAAMTKSVGSKVRKHLRCAVEHISWSRPKSSLDELRCPAAKSSSAKRACFPERKHHLLAALSRVVYNRARFFMGVRRDAKRTEDTQSSW